MPRAIVVPPYSDEQVRRVGLAAVLLAGAGVVMMHDPTERPSFHADRRAIVPLTKAAPQRADQDVPFTPSPRSAYRPDPEPPVVPGIRAPRAPVRPAAEAGRRGTPKPVAVPPIVERPDPTNAQEIAAPSLAAPEIDLSNPLTNAVVPADRPDGAVPLVDAGQLSISPETSSAGPSPSQRLDDLRSSDIREPYDPIAPARKIAIAPPATLPDTPAAARPTAAALAAAPPDAVEAPTPATYPVAVRPAPTVGGARTSPQSPAPSIANITQTSDGVRFEVAAMINDAPGGRISILIPEADGEHPEVVAGGMAVRLGDILQLLRPRMDAAAFVEMSSSSHADDYITFDSLRAHGIAVSFDRHDRLVLRAT